MSRTLLAKGSRGALVATVQRSLLAKRRTGSYVASNSRSVTWALPGDEELKDVHACESSSPAYFIAYSISSWCNPGGFPHSPRAFHCGGNSNRAKALPTTRAYVRRRRAGFLERKKRTRFACPLYANCKPSVRFPRSACGSDAEAISRRPGVPAVFGPPA